MPCLRCYKHDANGQTNLGSAASKLRHTEDVSHYDVRSLRLRTQGMSRNQENQDRNLAANVRLIGSESIASSNRISITKPPSTPTARALSNPRKSVVICGPMKVILETDRLLLREFAEEDADAFFRLNSDPQVLRFVPDKQLLNVEQARQILIDHPMADYRKHGFGRGACILKSTGENIGFAGLKYLEELGEVDVAYRLMPAYWGQGLATEVALASVRYGFAELGLKRIIGLAMPDNVASVRVLKRPTCALPKQ